MTRPHICPQCGGPSRSYLGTRWGWHCSTCVAKQIGYQQTPPRAVEPLPMMAPATPTNPIGRTAPVIERDTRPDGTRRWRVNCPNCTGRHWIPAGDTTRICPRTDRRYVVAPPAGTP